MAFDTRELFARLLKCESGGEGIEGMRAVASVIINRSTVPYGECAGNHYTAKSVYLLKDFRRGSVQFAKCV